MERQILLLIFILGCLWLLMDEVIGGRTLQKWVYLFAPRGNIQTPAGEVK